MSETPVRHDYSHGTHKSGWGIIDFDFHAPGMAKLRAFGLKRHIPNTTLQQKYLLPGEEVVISMPDGEVLYEISDIRYLRDPYDMYEATVRYIQHLTGWRTVGQREERQRARSAEWAQQRRQRG